MLVLSVKEAVRNRQENRPSSIWSTPPSATQPQTHEAVVEGNGGERVFNGKLKIHHRPKWKLSRDSAFFAAGSCFAREIELALSNLGKTVYSWNPGIKTGNQYFHRYNTFSIQNDFDFARNDSFGAAYLYELPDGKYGDYTGYGIWPSLQEAISEREDVLARYKLWPKADVLILTLGLVEAWFDKKNGVYLNISPYQLFHKGADGFELHVTNYIENAAALRKLIVSLTEQSPALKIILTVSPVPFSDTFSGLDVVVANTYSKAVLRSVASDISLEYPNVDYFPSYEMVTLSQHDESWLPDNRHVQREQVQHIVKSFTEMYFE